MSNKIKRIDIKEFREMGLLTEVNRTFFHPLGLALEVIIDDETGEEKLGGIWDYREDPEGILYHEENFPTEKVEKAQEFIKSQYEKRFKTLGYIIQEPPKTEK